MTSPGTEPIGAICPYLGLTDDADSHATYATEAHRCYRMPTPTRIALNHQETFCISGNYGACPVYRGEGVPGARAGGAPGPARGFAETAPRGPSPAGRPAAIRRPGARRPAPGSVGLPRRGGGMSLPVATVGLFALALGLVVLAIVIQRALSGGGGDELSAAERFQTQQALGRGTATATAQTPTGGTATVTGTATPSGATSTPAATGTPEGTRTPGAQRTYVVKSGDTCYGIAQEFGITVEQLRQANGLDENCTIYPNQELIIPSR